MNIPTNLAVAFIQSADRKAGGSDDLVTAKEIAKQARSYIEQRQKEVDAGNLEAAKGFEPSINFAASMFFGGADREGQVPDFNGDGMISVAEVLKLDRNKDGMITDEERQSFFGPPDQQASFITPADIESLKNMGATGGGLFGLGNGPDVRFKSKKKPSEDLPPPTPSPINPFGSSGQGPAFLPINGNTNVLSNGAFPTFGGLPSSGFNTGAPATSTDMNTITQLLTMILGGQVGQPAAQVQQPSPIDMNQLLQILMMMA
jgi:hypothetical protein